MDIYKQLAQNAPFTAYQTEGKEEMKLYEMIQNIRIFLIKLEIQIKLLSEKDFEKLLKDEKLDYTQKIYLCCFRYI